MTKEEAEAAAEKRRSTKTDWFCPLIVGDCNKRCYSFVKAKAVQVGYRDESWVVSEPYCSAHALVGE